MSDFVARLRQAEELFCTAYKVEQTIVSKAADRIELLEDALRLCIDMITVNNINIPHTLETARAALEEK